MTQEQDCEARYHAYMRRSKELDEIEKGVAEANRQFKWSVLTTGLSGMTLVTASVINVTMWAFGQWYWLIWGASFGGLIGSLVWRHRLLKRLENYKFRLGVLGMDMR